MKSLRLMGSRRQIGAGNFLRHEYASSTTISARACGARIWRGASCWSRMTVTSSRWTLKLSAAGVASVAPGRAACRQIRPADSPSLALPILRRASMPCRSMPPLPAPQSPLAQAPFRRDATAMASMLPKTVINRPRRWRLRLGSDRLGSGWRGWSHGRSPERGSDRRGG